MKQITFDELEKRVTYGDWTAFLYTDGFQSMTDEGDITEESLSNFYNAEVIHVYNMAELPDVKETLECTLLPPFDSEPEQKDEHEAYSCLRKRFAENDGEIAVCNVKGETTYMLVL